ncbi:hypothetical protein ACFQL1_13610 [Halomicroarcula sp. GCM10025709]
MAEEPLELREVVGVEDRPLIEEDDPGSRTTRRRFFVDPVFRYATRK